MYLMWKEFEKLFVMHNNEYQIFCDIKEKEIFQYLPFYLISPYRKYFGKWFRISLQILIVKYFGIKF